MNAERKHKSTQQGSLSHGHELADVHFGRIMIIGLGLLGVMVLGLVYSEFVEALFSETTAQPGAPAEVFVDVTNENLPPLPRVEPDPHANLIALRRTEDSVLTTYAWVSKDSGLVSIPIERAMELVLEKGILKSR
jgi:hypothetical protein